ncbi:prepilin-type N-terminal cleavage/methylation domain-containing protein [Pontibacterium sp. N1Y112]|uniref:Prepilin-type N-terminal cleavage/methylation domain-containing protein n=1 Tax=Pontibacterium sinense TaxID=2781979 RepID=A0A8J7FBU7_9GAMM|nr:prepilin-type N-terminal cleavage/methylation domain-containing protein [Pontibacterium sinense]MBE9396831.1 prepilin-type N-terminal cleavage/methylation domain-containing protein [Pontibacterium sinense]
MKKQAGFTIVELVVVIALLGILAAVALPRFLNVTDDAHNASVSGTGGALRSAAGLVKAQSVVDEASGTVTYDGTPVTINANLYPEADSHATCQSTWENILQNGAPVVATDDSTDYKAEWVAAAGAVAAHCKYTYNAIAAGTHFITYTPENGGVDITVP